MDTRAALARAGNTLVAAIFMIAFVLAFAFLARANLFGPDAGALFGALLERLPITAELIAASFVVAVAIGYLLAALSARAPALVRRLVEALLLVLRSIPFFWLAFVAPLVVAVVLKQQDVFGRAALDHFDLGDQLSHLVRPAVVLSIFQIPSISELFSSRVGSMSRRSVVKAVCAHFASRLPEVIGASLILEASFAWPGIGRVVFESVDYRHATIYSAVLLVGGIFVVAIRSIAVRDV